MKIHEQSKVKSEGLYPYQLCTRPFSINITVCKVFHCKYCSKYFPNNSRLMQDMLTHRKEKSCNGQDCNQSFFKKSHIVLDNMKAHDASINLCQCQHCNKSFSKRYLKIHSRRYTGNKLVSALQYDICLFYCLAQLMHMVIYLLDLLRYFKQKLHDSGCLHVQTAKF